MKKPLIVIFLVILIDQISKILVKTTMVINEAIPVIGNWFEISFIENEGMAFGLEIGGIAGKIILIVFRLAASAFLFWLLFKLVKKEVKFGPLFGISLIIAGALGNLIDGCFYGLIFSESTPTQVAVMFPDGGGYAGFMFGKVVDMLHFPLFTFPEWVPWLGGEEFFSPVFNIADSAITIGIFYLIIFQWSFIRNFESIIGVEKQHGERD